MILTSAIIHTYYDAIYKTDKSLFVVIRGYTRD
jgi:hypothetical protein